MKMIASVTAITLLAAGLGISPAQAEPGGCLKYGAVGAAGGHLAHHGVLGAVGGCAAGMWRRHEYRKHRRVMSRQYTRPQYDNGQRGSTYSR